MMVALAGPKYAGGGLVLALIMCSVAIACVQAVFGNALVTQGRQSVLLKVSITILIANGLLNLAAIPAFGDRGAAGALLLTETLSLTLTLRVYSRLAPLPRLHDTGRLLLALAALIAAATACQLIQSPVVAIVVGVAVGLSAYGAVLLALGALPSYVREPFESGFRAIRPKGAG
jgi:O-antigen/teichoic acid export membrane protein